MLSNTRQELSFSLLSSCMFGKAWPLGYQVHYPFFSAVDYPNSGLPVDIHMTAFNPCIPLNSKDSGIPIIIFNFDVTNPLAEDVQVCTSLTA